MTAFKQVLTNLQAGQREEALIGLEFVLRLDPRFVPATNLQRQLASGSKEIDLGDIIEQLEAPTTEAINGLLIEAVESFNARDFLGAKEKVERVLIDLPGHAEARELRDQIDNALKIENQVGQFLVQAREALAAGDPQEAANFVMMAQALDPHHTGIASTLKEIDETGGLALSHATPGVPPQPEPVAANSSAAPPGSYQSEHEAPAEAPFDLGADQSSAATGEPQPTTPTDVPKDDDAFAVAFDTDDPFGDIVEQTAGPVDDARPGDSQHGGVGTHTPTDDAVAFPSMDDAADLFESQPEEAPADADLFAVGTEDLFDSEATAPAAAGTPPTDEDSVAEQISTLIDKGQAAFDENDEPQAIAHWSRIFLLKPNHPEAGHLIVQAKKRLAETQAEIDPVLARARDAYDAGDVDSAQVLLSKIFGIRPNHIEATILKEQLERDGVDTATAAAAADTSEKSALDLPDLDDDLFSETGAAKDDSGDGFDEDLIDDDLFSEDEDQDDFVDFDDVTLLGRLKGNRIVFFSAIAALALLVVLAGVWLGGSLLSSEPEVDDATAVNEILLQAERLMKANRGEEALHILREFPASGLSKQRIDMRIAKIEQALAPPTPTPVPEEATRAQRLLDQGLWWAAFTAANEGLQAHPGDSGLEEVRRAVLEIEPEAASLASVLRAGDYRSAVSIAEDLVVQYGGQGDLQVVLERSLFNAALAESRAYNLTGAEKLLQRLLELKPGDEEAARFLEFVQKYKVRAADMRLEIFIRSLNER